MKNIKIWLKAWEKAPTYKKLVLVGPILISVTVTLLDLGGAVGGYFFADSRGEDTFPCILFALACGLATFLISAIVFGPLAAIYQTAENSEKSFLLLQEIASSVNAASKTSD